MLARERGKSDSKGFCYPPGITMCMYRESELLGKEVISSDGEIVGEVIEITVKDDAPCIVVGDKRPLVTKDRVLHSEKTVAIPYYEIEAVHDKIILSKTVEELLKET